MNRFAINTLTLLFAASASALGQTGSDDCSSADAIAGQGSFAFDSSAATQGSEGQTEALCYQLGSSTIDHDLWFDWTADVSGTATLKSCTSSVDTKLAVYSAGGCPTAGSALACNDDACGFQSELSFLVTSGSSYALQVGTFPASPGGAGQFELSIAAAVSNDECSSRTVITGAGSYAFDNAGATIGAEGQSEPGCYIFGSSAIDHDVWYQWDTFVSGTALISTCGSSVDTKLSVHVGTVCPSQGSTIACNDDSCGIQSQVMFPVSAGNTYMIQLGTYPGAAGGTGVMDITLSPAPSADECSTPEQIAGQGSFSFDTTFATAGLEGQSQSLCYEFTTSAFDHDLWYEWTSDVDGEVRVSTCGSGLDTKLAAYPAGGCPTNNSALACNDDAESCQGVQSEILFVATPGTKYLLQLGGFPGSLPGSGSFSVDVPPALEPGVSFCDCTSGNEPCSNPGVSGKGCANGADAEGALLVAAGTADVGADSLLLSVSGVPPNQPGLYFQGQNQVNGGAGNPFGDGLRCVGGDVRRLGVVFSDAQGSSDTSGFAQTISTLGGVSVGELRSYQVWYRDPLTSVCGALFNLSNGYTIQW